MKKFFSILAFSLLLAAMPTVKTNAITDVPDWWAFMTTTANDFYGWGFNLASSNGYEESVSGYYGTNLYVIPHFASADVTIKTSWGYFKPANDKNVAVTKLGGTLFETTDGQLNGMSTNTLLYTLKSTEISDPNTTFNLKFVGNDENYLTASWSAVENATQYYYQVMDKDFKRVAYGYTDELSWTHYSPSEEEARYYLVVVALNVNEPLTYQSEQLDFVPKTIGHVKIRVQIPTGMQFSGDEIYVYAYDYNDESKFSTCEKMDAKADRWFEKELDLSIVSAGISFSNKIVSTLSDITPAIWPDNIKSAGDKCYVLVGSPSYYGLLEVDKCAAADNDYRATNIKVTSTPGKAVYTWGAKDKAPRYQVTIDGNDYYPEKPEAIWYSNKDAATTAPKISIYALDENWNTVSAIVEHTPTESVEASVYIPELTVVDNKDNTFTISWEAVQEADYYNPETKCPTCSYYASHNSQRALTFTTDVLGDAGIWSFRLNVCDKDGFVMGSAEASLPLAALYNIDKAQVRALIPSDSRFDLKNGVWAFWTSPSNSTGTSVKGEPEAEGSRWYVFNLENVKDPKYHFMLIDNAAKASATQKTSTIYDITIRNNCYVVAYDPSSTHDLSATECDATDHNYTPTDLKADVSVNGRALLSWTSEDQIKDDWYYEIYVKFNDGKSPSEKWLYPAAKGPANSVTLFSETDRKVELWRVSVNRGGSFIAGSDNGAGFELKGATLGLTDLKAESDDKTNYTFTWKDAANTGSYRISFYDDYTCLPNELVYEDFTTSTTYSHRFLTGADTYWRVYAIDKDENILSYADGSKFTADPPVDALNIDKLDVTVDRMTATFSWETNAQNYRLHLDPSDGSDDILFDNPKSPFKYTFKTASYIYWSIEAVETNSRGKVFVITYSYGMPFELFMPAEKYYTLTISAGEGGTVNESVNGNYAEGTEVQIEATADSGKKFSEWSDGDKEASRKVKMTKDITLQAKFADAPKYKLTVGVKPANSGIVKINGTEAEEYEDYEGTEVTLEAVANESWLFSKWSEGETTEKITVVLDKKKDYTAIFEEKDKDALETISADGIVSLSGRTISISNPSGEQVNIYNAAGLCLSSGENVFTVPTAGMYIVRLGNSAIKVVIR